MRSGYASPAFRLRVRGVAVTYSVRFSGGGIYSFLGLEYSDVITLGSRVFRVLLPILPASLRFLRCELGLRWPSCLAPRPRCGCHLFGAHLRWGNRFLGKVITLTSSGFRVLLPILPPGLRFLRIFGFVGVTWCCDPTFLS